MISIRFDTRDLDRMLARLGSHISTETMPIIGPIALRQIRQDAAAGHGPDSQTWAPYSERHAKRRRRLGLPVDKVTLRMKKQNSYLDRLSVEGRRLGPPEELEGQAEGLQLKRNHLSVGATTANMMALALVNRMNSLA